MFLRKDVRLLGQQRHGADNLLSAGDQRNGGIGAARLGASQRNAFRWEARILCRIANQQRVTFFEHPLASGRRTRLFLRIEAKLRLEP